MAALDILLDQGQIAERVRHLGLALREKLADHENEVVLVGLLRGAIFFFVDLIRAMDSPDWPFELIRASSYADNAESGGPATQSAGRVNVTNDPALGNVAGKVVVLIDDIIDTGLTLHTLADTLKTHGAKQVLTVVLLDKPSRRKIEFSADFVGFEIPDHFVVGYGLDCAGKFRNLPDICIVNESH